MSSVDDKIEGGNGLNANDELSYLAKVARLYYLEENSQQEIARRMNVSVATISRALRRAKQHGVVRISIDPAHSEMGDLELAMEKRWGLLECSVVPRYERIERTYMDMAVVMTDMLNRLVRRGQTVGVSWGETLKTISENLGSVRGQDGRVIPIIGAMGAIDSGIYPNNIAREFARRTGGTPYLVNIPAVVDDSSIRDSMLRDSHFRTVREIWRSLDIAILSVSGLDEGTSAYRSGIFSSDELRALRERGGVCATNFAILDADGRVIDNPISERIVSLPFEELARIPHVIVTAAGAQKVDALRAVLKTGFVTRLITDSNSARDLVDR